MIVKHPTIKGLLKSVPDEQLPRWEAAGWVRCRIVGEQGAELFVPESSGHIVPDAPMAPPCPTCGASGDDPCVTFHSNQPTRRHASRAPAPEDSEES